MAKTRVQTEDVVGIIKNINDLVQCYKNSADSILGHIESFPWWSGTDKEVFQKTAVSAIQEYDKLAVELTLLNQTIEVCMSRYETVFEETKKKSKTI